MHQQELARSGWRPFAIRGGHLHGIVAIGGAAVRVARASERLAGDGADVARFRPSLGAGLAAAILLIDLACRHCDPQALPAVLTWHQVCGAVRVAEFVRGLRHVTSVFDGLC